MRPAFSHPLRVRYADTDAQGHVYFANYLTYADEGLSAWMRHLGLPYEVVVELGVDFVFADAHVRYRERALFEDLLHVHVGLLRLGRTSVVTRFEVVRAADEVLLAEGELVQVCLRMPERVKCPVPADIRLLMQSSGLQAPG